MANSNPKDVMIDKDGLFTIDENKAVIKIEYDDLGKAFYYIRTYTKGMNSGNLVDVTDINLSFEQYNNQRGKPLYAFVRVNRATYLEYLEFTKDKRLAHLKVAERFRLHD